MPARELVVAGSADVPQPRDRHLAPNVWWSCDAVVHGSAALQYPPGPSSRVIGPPLQFGGATSCECPWRPPRRPIAAPEAGTAQHDRPAEVHRREWCHGLGRHLPCVLHQGTVSLIPSCMLVLQAPLNTTRRVISLCSLQILPSRLLLVYKQDCYCCSGKSGVCGGTHLVQPHNKGGQRLCCVVTAKVCVWTQSRCAGFPRHPEGVRGRKNK